jgi:hypothetical protein
MYEKEKKTWSHKIKNRKKIAKKKRGKGTKIKKKITIRRKRREKNKLIEGDE